MTTQTFSATHKITITGEASIMTDDGVVGCDEAREILVQKELGEDGGAILYTAEEWAAGAQADWELSTDGDLLFQGGAYPGTGVEVRLRKA